MKAVLMVIRPKWCEKIFRGEKTVEVRKVAPKLEPPFKVYVYCTRQKVNGEILLTYDKKIEGRNRGFRNRGDVPLAGKVIGEFVCENVEKFTVGSLRSDDIEKLGCLSYIELINYFYKPWELDGKTPKQGYALHITAVKIYDTPKSLNSFKIACNKSIQCNSCEYRALVWHEDKKDFYYECGRPAITHPPRSWRYVEEL